MLRKAIPGVSALVVIAAVLTLGYVLNRSQPPAMGDYDDLHMVCSRDPFQAECILLGR